MKRGTFLMGVMLALATARAQALDSLPVSNFSLGVDSEGVPKTWRLREKSGRADLSVVKVEGLDALRMRSTNTSFALQKEIRVDLGVYPVLSWKWKVTKLPEGGDFRKTRKDDQAAQLFVVLSRTKAIVYIWDTTAPKGLTGNAAAPPGMSIKVVVVRSGPAETGKWISETRNVSEDYQRLYGPTDKAPVAAGMRIQINTQHTRTSAESYIADVRFGK
jgi:hypothetical protein